MGRQLVLAEAVLAASGLAGERFDRLHDVPAPAVVGADGEVHRGVVGGQRLGPAGPCPPAACRSGLRSPTTRRRMLLRVNALDLALEGLDEELHEEGHSSFGRRQFSELNANSVRNRPCGPGRCGPSRARNPRPWHGWQRGIRRFRAQRPLPSMMIAMCRGTVQSRESPRGADERQSHHDFSAW